MSQHFCPSSGMQAQVLVCKFASVHVNIVDTLHNGDRGGFCCGTEMSARNLE